MASVGRVTTAGWAALGGATAAPGVVAGSPEPRGAHPVPLPKSESAAPPDATDVEGAPADAVAASDGTCLVGELTKMLRQNGMDIGQNRLFRLLQADGYLGKSGSNRNVPTQRAMDLGLFRIKETTVTHADGHTTVSRTPKVTGKGQRYFIDRYWGRTQPTLEAGA